MITNLTKTNNNIKRIIIHIGLPKTGTTSIQKSLKKNAERLKDKDFDFLCPQRRSTNHGFILSIMFGDMPRYKQKLNKFNVYRKNSRRYIKREKMFETQIMRTKCKNVIITGETMSRFNENELFKIRSYFLSVAPLARITIVAAVRNPITLSVSGFQQRVKNGTKINFTDYLNRYKNHFEASLSPSKSVFVNDEMIVYKFEDSIKHPEGPFGMFMELITQRKPPYGLQIIRANTTISDKSIDILKFLNERIPLIKGHVSHKSRFITDRSNIKKIKGDKFSVTDEQHEIIRKISYKDTLWLKENFNIDYTREPIDKAYKSPNEMSFDKIYLDQFKKLFVYLLPALQKLSFDYVLFKMECIDKDNDNYKTFAELKEFIIKYDPCFATKDLNYFVATFENLHSYKKAIFFIKRNIRGKNKMKFLIPSRLAKTIKRSIIDARSCRWSMD